MHGLSSIATQCHVEESTACSEAFLPALSPTETARLSCVPMTTVDWSGVRDRVLSLGKAPGADEVFGSEGHQWVLEDPLSPQELLEVEEQMAVELPEDYREFLLHVGAGGAGPSYGIFVLKKTATEGWRWFNDGRGLVDHSRIGKPFPNPLHASADDLQDALDADHPDEYPERYPDPNSEEAKAAKRAWAVRSRQLDEDLRTTGALPVCHHGCGSTEWLAITGPEQGTMWCDPEGDGVHLIPDHLDDDPEGHRISFGQFYFAWLDEAEHAVGTPTT
ncbi:SMI1/KNR4 family protein [Streptomyces sp. NPDC015032]|uniref:SMI1/KNR4 family protein n=1 Tax=Streptomyces sp. NPDC015032 TaxID=3364937 RepID=UPI0036F6B82D